MHHDDFDSLTRRASLLALGAAGLLAFSDPLTTTAKKKNKRKKNRGDANELCKKQVGACESFIADGCGSEDGCLDEIACCSILANCGLSEFLFCLDAAIQS